MFPLTKGKLDIAASNAQLQFRVSAIMSKGQTSTVNSARQYLCTKCEISNATRLKSRTCRLDVTLFKLSIAQPAVPTSDGTIYTHMSDSKDIRKAGSALSPLK